MILLWIYVVIIGLLIPAYQYFNFGKIKQQIIENKVTKFFIYKKNQFTFMVIFNPFIYSNVFSRY